MSDAMMEEQKRPQRSTLCARWRWMYPSIILMSVLLVGCGGYTLRGRVVEGPAAGILLTPTGAEADAEGVEGARVVVYRDPTRQRTMAAEGRTGADGSFAIPVDGFGAGWMEEEWLVQVEHRGYQGVESILRLPGVGTGEQLTVTLSPGHGAPLRGSQDPIDDYERYRSEWPE